MRRNQVQRSTVHMLLRVSGWALRRCSEHSALAYRAGESFHQAILVQALNKSYRWVAGSTRLNHIRGVLTICIILDSITSYVNERKDGWLKGLSLPGLFRLRTPNLVPPPVECCALSITIYKFIYRLFLTASLKDLLITLLSYRFEIF